MLSCINSASSGLNAEVVVNRLKLAPERNF